MAITGIVLAGGKSLRLGTDKVRTTVGDKSLLQSVVTSISSLCAQILVVRSSERDIPVCGCPNLSIIKDILPGKGPLGGIYSGLIASPTRLNLVLACDMPFVNTSLLRYMLGQTENCDVVVPRIVNLVEPLHAVYSKNCLDIIEDMLRHGEFSVYRLLDRVKVRFIEAEEIDRFDPAHLSFFNINTMADLEKARQLTSGVQP